MIVAIHQPCYLPWLGYFAKIAQSDLFVLFDDVQFTRQNFQNRNRVKLPSGAHWLTVPVVRGAITDRICDKRIVDDDGPQGWRRRTWLTLETFYAKAPFFGLYRDELEAVYARPWELLVDLDQHLIELCMRWLGITTPIVRSSTLGASGQKTALIGQVCSRVGADVYLAGTGRSREYLDPEALARQGIEVRWQTFQHPIYPQLFPAQGFVSHMGVIDLLLNCGPSSREILLGGAGVPRITAAEAAAAGGEPFETAAP